MELPKLGSDSADYLSSPISERKTKLTRLFVMPIRRSPEKPGRELTVVWDRRAPLVEGFDNCYSYLVTFTEKGSFAGNHFHHNKQELFSPVVGSFTVFLENVKTKENEEITLETGQILYIPPNIAHTIISNSEISSLHVSATYPNNKEDEFSYPLLRK
ncbi:MAG: WxcM-like domain-containing protein [Candidatus Woesebacteria bacterium]|nr:WxcM-like domain-containing protein [Candidatus Woesebacteria bacterium]